MSNDKKQKGNWRLVLVGVVLGSLITAGVFLITSIDFNKAKNSKNSVVTTVKNVGWDWTGFSGKTFWNWLELLAVPILLTTLGYLYQRGDKKKAEKQAELEREIAKDNLAEEVIENYLKSMGNILLNETLTEQLFVDDQSQWLDRNNHVLHLTRALTREILRRLKDDTQRQKRIFQFLQDAELHRFILKGADLSGINLSRLRLNNVDLEEAVLHEANLQQANFSLKANLQGAYLVQANLQGAKLWNANLQRAWLGEADLQKADLKGSNLQGASLCRANLQEAVLVDVVETSSWNYEQTPEQIRQEIDELTQKIKRQIKSACNWDKAIYKAKFNNEKQIWEITEPDNTNFIENLRQDKSTDIEEPCIIL